MITLKSLGVKSTLNLNQRQVDGEQIAFFFGGYKVTCNLRDFIINSLNCRIKTIE